MDGPARPQFTSKQKRAWEKAQRAELKRLERLEKQRAKADKRKADDAEELAYFARWPRSKYPGLHDPTRNMGFARDERPEVSDDDGIYRKDKKTGEYPRLTEGLQRDEWKRSWRRQHEHWQRLRARFMRMHARSQADREIIYGTSLFYRDMRFWELRRVARASGWDERDPALWPWWISLPFKKRFRLITDTWLKGVRVNRRWIFQNALKLKEIAA